MEQVRGDQGSWFALWSGHSRACGNFLGSVEKNMFRAGIDGGIATIFRGNLSDQADSDSSLDIKSFREDLSFLSCIQQECMKDFFFSRLSPPATFAALSCDFPCADTTLHGRG